MSQQRNEDQDERQEQPGEQGLGGPDIGEPDGLDDAGSSDDERGEEGLGGPDVG